MKTFLTIVWRLIKSLPLLILSPLLILIPLIAIAASDLLLRRKKPSPPDRAPSNTSATIVIPNWNGRDLLEKYLPSVIAATAGEPRNEIIVVDNASADGSVEFIRRYYPSVRLLPLDRNRGFGGGSNAGFETAKNDIVVLLNSDMRVEPDFLHPLLEPFTDTKVFAVSCQIFFRDPARQREETGLTQGWWENGGLRVRHRIDEAISQPYPCFYGGGGSCAFDRRKFLELGGFDELFAPFYLEDTDLGYMAWKRGWKVLYQPRSVVYHEHRGTIGKHFNAGQIELVLKRNFLLFCWKNISEWRRVCSHFSFTFAGAVLSAIFGDAPERTNLQALWRAVLRLPKALRSRQQSHRLSTISDSEAFRRPLGGYFRDRFESLPVRASTPNVLFVSPYPICPPVHGGGVFMYQTTRLLADLCPLHLIVLLDHEWERGPHQELERKMASIEYVIRLEGKPKEIGSIVPYSVREFGSPALEWLIHRQIYTRQIDVIQFEYTALGQYAADFRQIPCILFEHDVYFQSIGRAWSGMHGAVRKIKAGFEYLRAIRYELNMLPRFDRIQVCSNENGDYLLSFKPELRGRIDSDLRAGIDTLRYSFSPDGREPYTMLFLGSFRHTPNQEALDWFVRHVLPCVLRQCPEARLIVIGSDPPPRHSLPDPSNAIELVGFVDDILQPLARYGVFVCPILSGSGMRVKLLEAFAAGIPVVSTHLGAEGLATKDGEVCALSDDPAEFADRIIDLFKDPERARQLAIRARELVVSTKDMGVMTKNLLESYKKAIQEKRKRNSEFGIQSRATGLF